MRSIYTVFFKPLLFLMPAETAHRITFFFLRVVNLVPGLRGMIRAVFFRRGPTVHAFGKALSSPIGLAAGFDKDGEAFDVLGDLGFGFVEIGTVTGQAQPGNPLPRLFRLPADRALVNRMGFNNHGASALAERLKKHTPSVVLGINIGKTKIVPEEAAAADYVESTRLLAPYADYLVVNVSSPNTPGLRNFQAVELLRPLLSEVKRAAEETVTSRRVPIFVKIAPDLSNDDIRAVAAMALDMELDGIVATNTTITRENLRSDPHSVEAIGAGGLSGAPLKSRSFEVLRILRKCTRGQLTLISVGGIENVEDVEARLHAGADLVQIYSAMIYEGPGLVGRLNEELRVRASRDV